MRPEMSPPLVRGSLTTATIHIRWIGQVANTRSLSTLRADPRPAAIRTRRIGRVSHVEPRVRYRWGADTPEGTVAIDGTLSAITPEDREGSFWRRLTPDERIALVKVGVLRRYPRGATLIRAGDHGQWTAVLRSGQVQVLDGGGTRVLATRGAGDVVGEQAVLDHGVRSATVVTLTPVRVLVVARQDLDSLLSTSHHMLRVLSAVVSERLRQADGTLAGMADGALAQVVRHLVHKAREIPFPHGAAIPVHINSQGALALELGLSRASVGRALKALRVDGVITTGRRVVTIRDFRVLRSLDIR